MTGWTGVTNWLVFFNCMQTASLRPRGHNDAVLPQNRQAVYDIWAKSGVPKEYFEREYKNQDIKVTTSPLVDDYVVAKYKTAAADAVRFGLLRKPVDLSVWFDRGPLNRALSTLHLEHFWTPYDASGKPAA